MIAAITPTIWNEPNRLNWPSRPRSGVATMVSGTFGTFRPQPTRFATEPSAPVFGPTPATASMMIARIVVPTRPIRIAPLTLRTTRTMVRSRPNTKVNIGQPLSSPNTPKLISGTPERTTPASTRPMIVMKRPMPTPMAYFSCSGTARKTAERKPVRTSSSMMMPSMTTRPMASAQVICGARVKATKPLRPRPAASATGKRPTMPMMMERSPATKAVAAATMVMALTTSVPPPTKLPFMSFAVPMMSGLSTTM